MFDIEKHVKEAIEKHPKLTLVEQCDTHACQAGHVFMVAAIANHTNTAALSTADLYDKSDADVKAALSARLQMIEDALVKKDA